jgi:hypothetical protein
MIKHHLPENDGAGAGPSGSSSILVARVERRASSPTKAIIVNAADDETTRKKADRKGKGKARDEDEPVKESKTALLRKGKLRADAEQAGETEEVEDRACHVYSSFWSSLMIPQFQVFALVENVAPIKPSSAKTALSPRLLSVQQLLRRSKRRRRSAVASPTRTNRHRRRRSRRRSALRRKRGRERRCKTSGDRVRLELSG